MSMTMPVTRPRSDCAVASGRRSADTMTSPSVIVLSENSVSLADTCNAAPTATLQVQMHAAPSRDAARAICDMCLENSSIQVFLDCYDHSVGSVNRAGRTSRGSLNGA